MNKRYEQENRRATFRCAQGSAAHVLFRCFQFGRAIHALARNSLYRGFEEMTVAAEDRKQIEAIGRELRKLTGKVTGDVTLAVQSRLFQMTPKRTGVSAASWIASVGRPDDKIYRSRRGGAAAPRAAAFAGRAKVLAGNASKPVTTFLTNNTIGASVSETGTATKAGSPYVARAIARGLTDVRSGSFRISIDDV